MVESDVSERTDLIACKLLGHHLIERRRICLTCLTEEFGPQEAAMVLTMMVDDEIIMEYNAIGDSSSAG